jgi:hypothetical protein
MTTSIYEQAHLVQLTPAGEWFVAIPHPHKPDVLVVDTAKNLTFADVYTLEAIAAVRPVPAFNRYINLRLEFVPGMLEASEFNLLAILLSQTVVDLQQRESDREHHLIVHTLLKVLQALGVGLHQALTAVPTREETPHIEHDFMAHGLQARLALVGQEGI